MPSISDSTMTLNTPVVAPAPVAIVAAPVAICTPVLRSTLPVSDVLDTVTAAASATATAPVQAVWKPTSGAVKAVGSPLSVIPPTTPNIQKGIGVPGEVRDPIAIQEPYKMSDGTVESLVAVSYKTWLGDPYFEGVRVWFSGYNGIAKPQLMAEGPGQPLEFTCMATKELVTVTVVAYGGGGREASFIGAPTCTVLLSGVLNAPPAPTISSPVAALSGGGWQFAWNTLNGLIANEVAGYWVYMSTSATTPVPPAKRVQWFAQPASNIGTQRYTDSDTATEYFWVSAVGTSGLESTLTSANTTTATNSYYPTTNVGGYWDASAANDGNEGSCSMGTEVSPSTPSNVALTNSEQEIWSAFPTYIGTAGPLVLKVLSDVTSSPFAGVGSAWALAYIYYSLDGGTTWTTIYGSGGTRSKMYDTVNLPAHQDLTQVQVKAFCSASSVDPTGQPNSYGTPANITVTHNIYELRIEVTQTEG